MKKSFPIILCVLFLFGCSNHVPIDKVTQLRSRVNSCQSCQFSATVTLDYGDSVYSFRSACTADANNSMTITIIEPEAVSGIEAKISGDSGKFTFAEEILGFEMIANDQIAPIGIPWLLMEALRGGYIASCGTDNNGNFVRIDDSFKQTEFTVELWLNDEDLPSEAELFWEGKRIASIEINTFTIV